MLVSGRVSLQKKNVVFQISICYPSKNTTSPNGIPEFNHSQRPRPLRLGYRPSSHPFEGIYYLWILDPRIFHPERNIPQTHPQATVGTSFGSWINPSRIEDLTNGPLYKKLLARAMIDTQGPRGPFNGSCWRFLRINSLFMWMFGGNMRQRHS